MLIRDGNRLICVTENEELKKKLIELDPGDLIQAPVKPFPDASPVIPYDSDAVSNAKIIIGKGIAGVMEVFNSLSGMSASRDRNDIMVLTKDALTKYLESIENNGTETLRKLVSEIGDFIKPTVKEILNQYMYESIDLLIDFESNSVHKKICDIIIAQGIERCRH